MPAHKKTLEEKQAFQIVKSINGALFDTGTKKCELADKVHVNHQRISAILNDPLKVSLGQMLKIINASGADITQALQIK